MTTDCVRVDVHVYTLTTHEFELQNNCLLGLSYIGGGFGKGIHNILEPAAFDTPIIFGPHYNKFNEAKDLIEIGGAKSIKNFNELQEAFSCFFSNYQKNICKNYIMQKCGSTKLVIKKI